MLYQFLIGSFFTMVIHKSNFARKILPSYGPISSYTFGNQLFIMINHSNLLKTCFKSNYLVNHSSVVKQLITRTFGDQLSHVCFFWCRKFTQIQKYPNTILFLI